MTGDPLWRPGSVSHSEDFDYELPPELIAQRPRAQRDAARLLVDLGGRGVDHLAIRDLPELVGPGDVLVVNDTRVLRARLRFRRPGGGAGEVLLLEERGNGAWEALVRPSRKVAAGTRVELGADLTVEVGQDLGQGRREVWPHTTDLHAALERHGEVPLPPYVHERLEQPERYQTVYARRPASAAAPTAGLHLTEAVLRGCCDAGAEIAHVELVVGLDTFRPLPPGDLSRHRMHTERYDVPDATWAACARAHRVVAVGTTVVRALESMAATGQRSGRTDLFIRPPYEPRAVDVLLTNFHLPRSSLLALLAAFVGTRWRMLYEEAIAAGYRFLSFGDAMLVERARRGEHR